MRAILLTTLSLSILLFAIVPVNAWSSYTHNWICDRAGITKAVPGIDCANADYDEMQSRYKDMASVHHHCTLNSSNCSARIYADKQKMYSYPEAAGFAAHLYADSMVPVHWYSTDYYTCHKIFEAKVEERLRNAEDKGFIMFGKEYDLYSWNITMQCLAKFGKENRTVELYADDMYMDSVAAYVAEEMGIVPDVNPEDAGRETYDFTPLIILFIILLVAVFVLFFYFGLKNKEDKKKRNNKN